MLKDKAGNIQCYIKPAVRNLSRPFLTVRAITPRCRHKAYAERHHKFKNSGILRVQRDLPEEDRLNQHCVNWNGKGLNVTDVHLYAKVLHTSFNGIC